MKRYRWCCWILAVLLCLTGCANGGSYAQMNLQGTIDIPQDGVVDSSILQQIRDQNGIGSFSGSSNGIAYEWTVFGSDITEAAELNLQVEIEDLGEEGVLLSFGQKEAFPFPMLLSVCLNDRWNTEGATAYDHGEAVASVALTGSQTTILNISVIGMAGVYTVLPNEPTEEPIPEPVEDDVIAPPEGASMEKTPEKAPASYLAPVTDTGGKVYSDGGAEKLDQYHTAPVPAGKPQPVEPEEQVVDKGQAYTCTFSIDCVTILNNLNQLNPDKLEMVPSDGMIFQKTEVAFYEGESVYDVLLRLCKENGIHMEASWTPMYNSAYVKGIRNLYQFDCGALSGWMYKVNGWYPNYGSSRYQLRDGDTVEWRYTCDLGYDVGGEYAVMG